MEGFFTRLAGVFSYESLVHAVSGATGSVIGLTAFFPLDTIRTRLQVHEGKRSQSTVSMAIDILQQEGMSGMYRGWFPVVSTLCCSNFVYFYVYNSLKILIRKDGVGLLPIQDLSFAYVAGVINVLATTPLWVANTRLKLQGTSADPTRDKDKPVYTGLVDCLLRIGHDEGVSAMWSGTGPSVILAGNPAVQFMVYEGLKRNLQIYFNTKELDGLIYFIIGAIAKLVATVVTYPLQLVQTRWRAGNSVNSRRKRVSLMHTIQDIIRRHGWRGLYRGLCAKLAQTVLMAALMFLTYEKIAAFVFWLMGMHHDVQR